MEMFDSFDEFDEARAAIKLQKQTKAANTGKAKKSEDTVPSETAEQPKKTRGRKKSQPVVEEVKAVED